jgi:LacI family transcriptional regulator
VEAAAKRLGYRRNSLAGSMVTGRTQTIGFIAYDIEDPFFARALRGVVDAARQAGFEVVIANSDGRIEMEQAAVRVFDEKRVDGLVIAPVLEGPHDHLARLSTRGVPVVCLDRDLRGIAADTVLTDNVRAARAGVEYLIRKGHRRIALVTTDVPGEDLLAELSRAALDPPGESPMVARCLGYLSALRAAGLPAASSLMRNAPETRAEVAAITEALLGLVPPPTAVFSTNDVATIGAYEALQCSSLDFPREISLLGFDDAEWATLVQPKLSVIAQPAYDLGATATRRLLARMSGDLAPPQLLLLEGKLVERDSVVPPPSESPGAEKLTAPAPGLRIRG